MAIFRGSFDASSIHLNGIDEIDQLEELTSFIGNELFIIEDSNNKKKVTLDTINLDCIKLHSTIPEICTLGVIPLNNNDLFFVLEDGSSHIKYKLNIDSLKDINAIHVNEPDEISGLANKLVCMPDDFILIEDSDDGYYKKSVRIGTLHDFDAVHLNQPSEIFTNVPPKNDVDSGDLFLIEDSKDVWNKKRIDFSKIYNKNFINPLKCGWINPTDSNQSNFIDFFTCDFSNEYILENDDLLLDVVVLKDNTVFMIGSNQITNKIFGIYKTDCGTFIKSQYGTTASPSLFGIISAEKNGKIAFAFDQHSSGDKYLLIADTNDLSSFNQYLIYSSIYDFHYITSIIYLDDNNIIVSIGDTSYLSEEKGKILRISINPFSVTTIYIPEDPGYFVHYLCRIGSKSIVGASRKRLFDGQHISFIISNDNGNTWDTYGYSTIFPLTKIVNIDNGILLYVSPTSIVKSIGSETFTASKINDVEYIGNNVIFIVGVDNNKLTYWLSYDGLKTCYSFDISAQNLPSEFIKFKFNFNNKKSYFLSTLQTDTYKGLFSKGFQVLNNPNDTHKDDIVFIQEDIILTEDCYNKTYLLDTSIQNPINIFLPKITSQCIGFKVTFVFYKYNTWMDDGLIINTNNLDAFSNGNNSFIIYNGESVTFINDGINIWSPYNYCTNNTFHIDKKYELNNLPIIPSLNTTDWLIIESSSNGLKHKISPQVLSGYGSYFTQAYVSEQLVNRRVKTITGNGSFDFNFYLPFDFLSFGVDGGMWMVGFISGAGAAATNRNIQFSIEYDQGVGSFKQAYISGNSGLLYDLSGMLNKRIQLRFDQYLTNAMPGMTGGINIKHNDISGNIDYIGIYTIYKKT